MDLGVWSEREGTSLEVERWRGGRVMRDRSALELAVARGPRGGPNAPFVGRFASATGACRWHGKLHFGDLTLAAVVHRAVHALVVRLGAGHVGRPSCGVPK